MNIELHADTIYADKSFSLIWLVDNQQEMGYDIAKLAEVAMIAGSNGEGDP